MNESKTKMAHENGRQSIPRGDRCCWMKAKWIGQSQAVGHGRQSMVEPKKRWVTGIC